MNNKRRYVLYIPYNSKIVFLYILTNILTYTFNVFAKILIQFYKIVKGYIVKKTLLEYIQNKLEIFKKVLT